MQSCRKSPQDWLGAGHTLTNISTQAHSRRVLRRMSREGWALAMRRLKKHQQPSARTRRDKAPFSKPASQEASQSASHSAFRNGLPENGNKLIQTSIRRRWRFLAMNSSLIMSPNIVKCQTMTGQRPSGQASKHPPNKVFASLSPEPVREIRTYTHLKACMGQSARVTSQIPVRANQIGSIHPTVKLVHSERRLCEYSSVLSH